MLILVSLLGRGTGDGIRRREGAVLNAAGLAREAAQARHGEAPRQPPLAYRTTGARLAVPVRLAILHRTSHL